jgi:hypothetical protein
LWFDTVNVRWTFFYNFEPAFLFDDPFLAVVRFGFLGTGLLSNDSLDAIEITSSCWLVCGEVRTVGDVDGLRTGVAREEIEG